MSKHQPMDKDAAARIQSAAARYPDCASAQSGFDRRAQSSADKNHDQDGNDVGVD
jgi:hypothetical protein